MTLTESNRVVLLTRGYLSGTVYWFGAFWSVYVLVQLYTDESLISKEMCNAS